MAIALGMKDIAQEITSSYDMRIAEVGKLREEAKEMLSSFQASHKEMSTELKKDLAQDKTEMQTEVGAMRNAFQTGHKKMGSALRKDLSRHTQAVKGEVTRMRQETRASHKEMSAELNKDLTQGVAARKSEVKGMLDDLRRSHKQMGTQLKKGLADYDRGIKSEVAEMQEEIRASHKEMSAELNKDLTQGVAARKSEVREMRSDFRKAQAAVRADSEAASAAWQELAWTMQAKRAGVKAPPKEEKVKVPLMEKEEVPVAAEEIPDLEAKLLAIITSHPEGIALAEVAEKLGVAPIVLGRASKSLIQKARIRKEDKLYFALGTE